MAVRPDSLGNWAATQWTDPKGPNIAAHTMNERGSASLYAEEVERVLRIRDKKIKELEGRIEKLQISIAAAVELYPEVHVKFDPDDVNEGRILRGEE